VVRGHYLLDGDHALGDEERFVIMKNHRIDYLGGRVRGSPV
jgi:hypothetical protein